MATKMDARIGDGKQRAKTMKTARAAGYDVRITLEGSHVQAFDGDVLVVSIMKVRPDLYAFRYNALYWGGE